MAKYRAGGNCPPPGRGALAQSGGSSRLGVQPQFCQPNLYRRNNDDGRWNRPNEVGYPHLKNQNPFTRRISGQNLSHRGNFTLLLGFIVYQFSEKFLLTLLGTFWVSDQRLVLDIMGRRYKGRKVLILSD